MNGPATSAPHRLRVTRVTNACVLLEIGPYTILTDPWFRAPWGFTETPGLSVADLPPLTAIVGSHCVIDHWDTKSLSALPDRARIPVLAATSSMVRRAKDQGFEQSRVLAWGDAVSPVPGLKIEAVAAQRTLGIPTNNYVMTSGGARIFFGGETRDLEPLRRYRRDNPAVDVVLAPVNGMRLLGWRLVTTAKEAVEAARILGAHTLIPIHDSMHFMGLGGPTSSSGELVHERIDRLRVLVGAPGECMEIPAVLGQHRDNPAGPGQRS